MTKRIDTWLKEARRHAQAGRTEAAEQLCRRILDTVPDHAGALLELARARYFRREIEEAIPMLESVLQREPDHTDARILLLYGCVESGAHDKALEIAHAIHRQSDHPDELLAAYLAFDFACDWENAASLRERIVDFAVDGQISTHQMSSLLMAMNAAPGIDPERMYQIHRAWAEAVERDATELSLKGSTPPPEGGRLKIGYLSADFCQHPVGHFIQPVLSHHDRARFEVHCYARLVKDDVRTHLIREACEHFVDVTQCSPFEMAQRIRDDGIHILIDLGGHTAMTCLGALAHRPAPLQITYLGYPNTTGLSTVDFRISDAFAEDLDQGTRYVENLLTMPQSFLCADEFMQEVARADTTPAVRNGYVTFGSFNHVRKLNPETIALWSRILNGVENSRFVIKSKDCDSPIIQKHILAEFARHGIAPERIDFYALMPRHEDHATIFREVDIALDSFPYNGTTTTCETLWLGVPVVTLVGPQHVQRTSYSILKNIGLDATVAHNPDEYVEKAVHLAGNTENLNVLRQCLPPLLRHSPLGQPEAITRQIEDLYLQAWQAKGFAAPAPEIDAPSPLPGKREQRHLLLCDRLDPLAWYALRTHCDAVAAGKSDAWLVMVVPAVFQQDRIELNIQRYLQLNYLEVEQHPQVHILRETQDPSLSHLLSQCAATYVIEPDDDLVASPYQEALKALAGDVDCPIHAVTPAAIAADRAAVKPMPALQDFKVTICMPTYNRCDLLKRAAHSVLSQDYENLELLISDNASDDGTEEFCRALAAQDPRVRYHRNAHNIGADANFFQLYEMIPSDLFVFCSDDDFLEPEYLQKAVDMYRAHPELGMVYGQCNVVDLGGTVVNRLDFGNTVDSIVDPRHELLESHLRNQIIWTSAMMRKTASERMLRKSEAMFGLDFHGIGQGTDYLFGVLMLSEVPSGYIDIACANFTINPDSVSATLLDRGLEADVFTLPRAHKLYDALFGTDSQAQRALRAGILIRSKRLQAALEQATHLPADAQRETLGKIQTVSDQLNSLLQTAWDAPAPAGYAAPDGPLSPEDWTGHVEQGMKAYRERPDDAAVHAQLRALRAVFVQTWLAADADQLAVVFATFEDGIRTLMFQGLRYEPLVEDEAILIQGLHQRLQSGVACDVQACLAAMLYQQPYEMPVCAEPAGLPAWFLDLYLDFMHTIPEIFRQEGEAERYLQTMRTWIGIVHAGVTHDDSPAWRRIGEQCALKLNLIPIYMADDSLKDLYIQRAEILATWLERQGNRLDHRFGARPASRQRIRLGILANHFTPQTETFSTIPFFEHLDRSRFEIILLSMAETGHRLEQYCRDHADRFLHLEGNVPECAQRIRELDLDMLLVASNVTAVTHQVTLLAEYRLARVQISSVASCTTSGMRHVDDYLSGSYTEPGDAQARYRERLHMVDGPAHCYNFATEDEAPTLSIDRARLGIPEDAVVYVSGSNYYKITPEVEAVWTRILADTPNAYLLLYPFNPNWSDAYATHPFITRLMTTFQNHGVDGQRIKLLEPLARQPDIKAVLALCDVYLDSFPFAGVTSLLDPLAVDLPVVSMQGDNFRTAMGGALLRELDVEELIAGDIDAYIALALRLGRDTNQRQALSRRIKAGMQASPRFIDSQAYGRHIEGILLEMAAERLGVKDTEPCL